MAMEASGIQTLSKQLPAALPQHKTKLRLRYTKDGGKRLPNDREQRSAYNVNKQIPP